MPSALRLWGTAFTPCGSYSEKTHGLPAFCQAAQEAAMFPHSPRYKQAVGGGGGVG